MKFNSLMVGTGNINEMVDFYTKVIKAPDMNMGGAFGWNFNGTWFTLMAHSEVSGKTKEPARILINFESEDVKSDFDRIKALGAKVVKEPYEMQGGFIATLEDPDGNYFQLNSPWSM